MARRLYKVLKAVLHDMPPDRDDIEAWDPELAEALTGEDRIGRWLGQEEQ